ncbi:hypothetical protein [Mesorhizobium sp. LNHC209A00]|uniref:hypothetical protein n=1 Tax=Mesorhizobium TaxID=68287 RepID=UPI0003CF60AF|nr:hypothetical protein [Mesorhizobium sp. LNHC209A00]ESY89604.1 hypothetical protein X741_30020 [Mesorhizobium sp. LNHC229A00]
MAALADAPVFADHPAEPREFPRHLVIEFDDLVERVCNLATQPIIDVFDTDGEIAVSKGFESAENLSRVQLFFW